MVKPLFCCSEYLVDSRGFVLSKRGKPLKPSVTHKGYEMVNIIVDGKRIGLAVHTAVAMAFCPGYKPGMQVNHKNGKKADNDSSNLEWITQKENVRHAIFVLDHNKIGANNPNAKPVLGINKKTKQVVYKFDCVMDAGKFFSNGDIKRARYIQNIICESINHPDKRKSYRGCIWQYIVVN